MKVTTTQIKILKHPDKKISMKMLENLMVMTAGHFCSQKNFVMPQICSRKGSMFRVSLGGQMKTSINCQRKEKDNCQKLGKKPQNFQKALITHDRLSSRPDRMI